MTNLLRQINRFAHPLRRDVAGNVLPIAAVGIITLAGIVGGGVDISRGYMAQNRLQNACDAGVLAGRRGVTTNGYDTAARNQANAYFNTNFDETNEGTSDTTFVTTPVDDSNTINGTASTQIRTAVMHLFGFASIDLAVDCTATMAFGNSDIMMVLDTTGSMSDPSGSGTRMQALQAAMNSFNQTLVTATAGSNARIRYGFVPYATNVNVGRLLPASALSDTMSVNTREPNFRTETIVTDNQIGWTDPVANNYTDNYSDTDSNWSYYEPYDRFTNQTNCNNSRPSNIAWSSLPNDVNNGQYINENKQRITFTQTRSVEQRVDYRCQYFDGGNTSVNGYYRQVRTRTRANSRLTEYTVEDPVYETQERVVWDSWTYRTLSKVDTRPYKGYNSGLDRFDAVATPTGANGAPRNTRWTGCIEERPTVTDAMFTYSSIGGMNPSGATDLDIDAVPVAGDPDTQWKLYLPAITYSRPNAAELTKTASDSPVTAYCPPQAQLLQVMTQQQFSDYTTTLEPFGGTYHDIGMTWGGRMINPDGVFASNVNEGATNGGGIARHLIFMTDGLLTVYDNLYTASGIERIDSKVTPDRGANGTNHFSRRTQRFEAVCQSIKAKGVRVWVIAFATGLNESLTRCASAQSAFTAENSGDLNTAFQDIAAQVGELRVTN